ncbi:MAG: hypothetical protein KDD48_06545 [Bdellovibrionales bacterium]|nr:hypothetical protein [Bdellovibrionales bacterium]
MRKLRILVLMHKDFIPPDQATQREREVAPWKTEFDVVYTLKQSGHEVLPLGVISNLEQIIDALANFKPHVVFNLLEEFDGESVFDQNIVSYLELKRVAYTGNGPHGLMLGRDKALSKKILQYHRIAVPKFQVVPLRRQVKRRSSLNFPLFVKSVSEEASLGISQASLVTNDQKLKERVEFVHDHIGTDAIIEQYIDGREIYVGVLGNSRLEVLPPCELIFGKSAQDMPKIATSKIKHSAAYREKHDIDTTSIELEEPLKTTVNKMCKRAFKHLYLQGYARFDLRIDHHGTPFILEANPNPDIAEIEDFAISAYYADIEYPELLERIIRLGISRQKKKA